MRRRDVPLRVSALGAAALLFSATSSAAPCARPDVDATSPPTGAKTVPRDAQLSAHYAAPASYDDEPVVLSDESGGDVPLRVIFDAALSTLQATPERALEAGQHRLEWPALRGVGSGGVGRGSTVSFSVVAEADSAGPMFDGLSGIDWDLARERDPCLDRLEDRFVFRLRVGEATDDAGFELLSLLVFETRAPSAADQREPAQVARQPYPTNRVVEVRRPATDGGSTCFAAVVQDLVGNVSGGGDRQVCVTTRSPPFFDGCALSPARPSPSGAGWLSACLAALLLRRGKLASPGAV